MDKQLIVVYESGGLVHSPSCSQPHGPSLTLQPALGCVRPSPEWLYLANKAENNPFLFSVLVFYQTDELKRLMEIFQKHQVGKGNGREENSSILQ